GSISDRNLMCPLATVANIPQTRSLRVPNPRLVTWTRHSRISASIETDTFENECLQCGRVDGVTLVEIDGTHRLAVQTRVEKPFRIFQLGSFWKRQPHRVLEGLADADDAVVGPDGHALGAGGFLPLHLFD